MEIFRQEKKGKYDVRIKAIKFDSGMDRVEDLELFQDLENCS